MQKPPPVVSLSVVALSAACVFAQPHAALSATNRAKTGKLAGEYLSIIIENSFLWLHRSGQGCIGLIGPRAVSARGLEDGKTCCKMVRFHRELKAIMCSSVMRKKKCVALPASVLPRLRVMYGRAAALGSGRVQLLELIGETGNSRSPAARMGVAYLMAWK